MYRYITFFIFIIITSLHASFMPAIELSDSKIEFIKKVVDLELKDSDTSYDTPTGFEIGYIYNKNNQKVGMVLEDIDHNLFVTLRILNTFFQQDDEGLNDFGVMVNYDTLYQDIRTHLLKTVRNIANSKSTITFCGEGDEGALATLAAFDFINSVQYPIQLNQIHLVTFFAPPIANRYFIEQLNKRIRIENILNFVIHPVSGRSSIYHSPGIQVEVLPTELADSYGLRGACQVIELLGYCFNFYDMHSHQKIRVPSFETLRKVVAHYQLSYFAHKSELDNSDELLTVGNVSFFSTSRGLLKPFYQIIS